MTRKKSYELDFTPQRPEGIDDKAVMTTLRVPPELAGMRLDRFLQGELRRTSRTRAQLIVRVSAFTPEGKRLRPSYRVRSEDYVMLWRAAWDEEEPEAKIRVLFEDEHYIAVDKPAGIPVHPSARYYRSTVVKILETDRPGERFFLAHRLDRETSGVLLLSKTHEADRAIKRMFAGLEAIPKKGPKSAVRMIEKQYLALSRGAPEQDQFRSEAPLEEDSSSALRVKMRVARPGEGLEARTAFEVLGRRRSEEKDQWYSLVKCTLETGRQHQIRLHLSHLGLPIVGEKLYGVDDQLFARGADRELTEEDLLLLELPRHALHAHVLGFEHPFGDREPFRVVSPMPEDMRGFWSALEE